MHHNCFYMLDIETCGLSQDTMIRQIGVTFYHPTMHTKDTLRRGGLPSLELVPIDDGTRSISPSTIHWQQKQGEPISSHLGRHSRVTCIEELVAFCESGNDEPPIFSKGPHFDIAILENYMPGIIDLLGYRRFLDVRTIFWAMGLGEGSDVDVEAYGNFGFDQNRSAHDAIWDCYYQTAQVLAAFD